MGNLVSILELAWYELALLAACGVILLGADDVLVDGLCFVLRRGDAVLSPGEDHPPLKLAIFVPAWDEANVIGHMISACKARWNDEGWVVFVGCYPNDPATRLAILPETGARVVLVVNEAEGPTTKADCLNALWRGLRRYEHAHGTMFDAIVLHDAEDLADPWELQVYRHGLQQFDMVQIPVCPLTSSPLALIAGHYLDEFAEAHGKDLVVRSAIGAGLPSAGVGSAIRRQALARLAETNAGGPFDAASLTEDYELGLRLKECGCSSAFLRLRNPDDG
jgi:adsorption protein B